MHHVLGASSFAYCLTCCHCVITQTPTLCFAALSFFLSFFIHREISAVSRPIAAKLCHMIGNGCSFKNKVQNLGVLPQKIWCRKPCFFGVISDDFTLRSRISPEWNKISTIGKRRCKLRSLPRLLT